MIRQRLKIFAVTIAFAVGAAATEILLGFEGVRVLLGLANDASASLQGIAGYFGIAILAGLIVDGLRFAASHWWERNGQLENDLEVIFTSNLA